MDKTCIFCGGRVNSKEDIWPKWVLKLLKKSDDEKVPMKTRRDKEGPKQWMTTDSALKVGNVCSGCNNGWMSRLEDEVKPIIEPMIFGTARTLNALQQERIAAWLTKNAIMFLSLVQRDSFYNASDRRHFRGAVTPFLGSYVWLGHYSEAGDLRGSLYHETLKTTRSSGSFYLTHVLTMSIGHVVAQIASIKRSEDDDLAATVDFSTRGPRLTDALVQDWPVNLQDVSWPPSLSFNTDRLELLAYRFRR